MTAVCVVEENKVSNCWMIQDVWRMQRKGGEEKGRESGREEV